MSAVPDPDGTDAVAKAIVEQGYDAVSLHYRADDEYPPGYRAWTPMLTAVLPRSSDVLDLGCGCGVPMSRHLAALGHRVLGVDISRTQIERAERLVPDAKFMHGDAADAAFEPSSLDGIVCLYMLIHLPQPEQKALIHKMSVWPRAGGVLLATTGATAWTGEEQNWLDGGAAMWWSHPDADTYRDWLTEADFSIEHEEFVPEGTSGHQLFLARKR